MLRERFCSKLLTVSLFLYQLVQSHKQTCVYTLMFDLYHDSSALKLILHDPSVSPTTHSIASRVLLSINLSLPLVAPSHLSPDLTLYTRVREKVQKLCLELGTGTSSAMSKSLNLLLNSGDLSHLVSHPDILQAAYLSQRLY